MASFGIGLGAFVDGMQAGMAMRDRIDERNRTKANRAALDKIDQDAKAQFGEMVQKGEAQPDQFGDFWMKYALPKRSMELIRQGDIAGARALREWGESDAALQGGRLFSRAMVKAQTGDVSGAMDDAIAAGQVKGYLDHNYQLVSKEPIQDPDGNTLGFRLHLKTDNGEEMKQDIAVGDIPKMIAIYANPDAAWKSQQDAAAAKKKRSDELEDYETKKKIDRRYDKPKEVDDAKAYRDVAADLAKNDLDWASRSADEQDKLIRDRMNASKRYATESAAAPDAGAPIGLGGAAPASPGRILVDQATGERVDPGAQSGLGLGAPPAAAAPAPAPAHAPTTSSPSEAGALVGDMVKPVPSTRTANEAPSGAAPADKATMVGVATTMLRKGANPSEVTRKLAEAGIGEQDWTPELRSALIRNSASAGPIGLGR